MLTGTLRPIKNFIITPSHSRKDTSCQEDFKYQGGGFFFFLSRFNFFYRFERGI
jgi:hypothetical protein